MAFLLPAAARADDPPVTISMARWEGAAERGLSPDFTYVLSLRATGDAEVVADRRLLELTVRPERGRRFVCRHPGAPRTVDAARVRSLHAGESFEEWIDLRMLCWGRALRALEAGATVEVRFGFRARGRDRWVARAGQARVHRLTGEPFRFDARPVPARPADAQAAVEMRPVDARHGDLVFFRVAVRGTDTPARVYVRDDLFHFAVRGPLGARECEIERLPREPIIDFYRRVSRRRAVRAVLSGRRFCDDDAFPIAGVYEVTPVVDLVYDGDRWNIQALTGSFTGAAVPVRIRTGRYVEQPITGDLPVRVDDPDLL